MKRLLNRNSINIAAFAVVFYITSIFITLDIYCRNQVTPETPLYNIAGLPFLRMDFVMIVFTLAFSAGTILSVILKKCSKTITSFALGALGCIAIFMFLFDVNTMQLIAPTMRISHVIMTVSRVLAIFAGASGIFAGLTAANISKYSLSKKPLIISSASAIILSVIANAENIQTVLYLICGILLLTSSIIFDFSNKNDIADKNSNTKPKKLIAAEFISTLSITVIFGILYSALCNNAGAGETVFTVTSGLVLLVLIISFDMNKTGIIKSIALLLGSIISYVLIHYTSEVITYSGNRVVYVMPYFIVIIFFITAAFSITYHLICRYKSARNARQQS